MPGGTGTLETESGSFEYGDEAVRAAGKGLSVGSPLSTAPPRPPGGCPQPGSRGVNDVIRHPRHVIAVHDLARSAAFYRDVLGFEVREIGDPGWRFLLKDDCFIMAGECRDAMSPGDLGDHSYFAYLEVDDIDRYYEAVRARNATVTKTLRDEPWGMREFGIRTIDGHRIMFGCPIES